MSLSMTSLLCKLLEYFKLLKNRGFLLQFISANLCTYSYKYCQPNIVLVQLLYYYYLLVIQAILW